MQPKQYRQEIKQLLNSAQTMLLQQRIAAILPRDEHSSPDGSYQIRSIYFDTFDDRAYLEKEAGISEREKLRIRFYNYSPGEIRLERKEKRENLIHKDSLSISKEDTESIMQGNYKVLTRYNTPLTDYMYGLVRGSGLHPAVIVDYVRRAYVYPIGNVRITFDTALHSGRPDIPIWDSGNVFEVLNGYTILEIKFNQYLPEHIRMVLESVSGERMALSKYTLCRQNLLLKQGDYLGGRQ